MTDETCQLPSSLLPPRADPPQPRDLPARTGRPHGPPRGSDPPDELLASLGRRFCGATLRLEFELRSATARQIFHRDFVYVSQQLHALESSRRVQALDRQVLKEALAAVARRADAVRAVLLLCGSEARSLIAAQGHEETSVEFPHPTRLQATIVSPFARDFIDLLGHADDALGQIEKAWLLGLTEASEKARQVSECRRALLAFKEAVREQRHKVGTQVREANAASRLATKARCALEEPAQLAVQAGNGEASEASTAEPRPPHPAREEMPALPPEALLPPGPQVALDPRPPAKRTRPADESINESSINESTNESVGEPARASAPDTTTAPGPAPEVAAPRREPPARPARPLTAGATRGNALSISSFADLAQLCIDAGPPPTPLAAHEDTAHDADRHPDSLRPAAFEAEFQATLACRPNDGTEPEPAQDDPRA